MLTNAQLQVLKADIAGDPALNSQPNNSDGNTVISNAYNAPASPDFWVWRQNVTRTEVYHLTSAEGTNWDWTVFKNQVVAEQNAWLQIFLNDEANFSLPNVRAGADAIFSGAGAPAAQRTHIKAIAKRRASRGEKLFANVSGGNGAQATPATMTTNTPITQQDVDSARNLP